MAVPVRVLQVLDHREPHALGGPEAERGRVTDVQRDDLVALPRERVGSMGELPADLVPDVAEAFAGAERGVVWHSRPSTNNPPALRTAMGLISDAVEPPGSRASDGTRLPGPGRRFPGPAPACGRSPPHAGIAYGRRSLTAEPGATAAHPRGVPEAPGLQVRVRHEDRFEQYLGVGMGGRAIQAPP